MKFGNLLAILALSLFLGACDFNGGVEQGRCVAFDPDAKTVTLVVDTAIDQQNPHYSGAVDTFKLPLEAMDMGPAPVPGGRLMLEPGNGKKEVEPGPGKLLYYDPEAKAIKEMAITYTDVEKNINARHPKLKGKDFPIIDKEKRTVTVYSPRLEELVTFEVPEDAISLPDYVWKAGDEVRIAFRKDNRQQAIRLMNVSKTSIFTR